MTYEQAAEKLGRGGLLNLFAAKELKARDAISDDELMLGLTDHADGKWKWEFTTIHIKLSGKRIKELMSGVSLVSFRFGAPSQSAPR